MRQPSIHEYSRSHPQVLEAFRDVVQLPSKCTVRVICGTKQVALGTIVDPDGLILTKASELDGPVTCVLNDGTACDAELVGTDHTSDLCLLRITAENLPCIDWSDIDPPAVGGWVVTPGPGALPQAIGIVSVAAHQVRGGVLGVQLNEDEPGPRIAFVVPDSGAAKAGLRTGDIVTHINGKPIKDSDTLIATTSGSLPGDKLKLTLLRYGVQRNVIATLGSVADTLTSPRARFQDQLGGPLSKRRFLFPSALEHDSILQPNQCGGPLLDLNGKAVGINIARANRIASYAIPAKVVRPILESLRSRTLTPVSHENETADNSSSGKPDL
jgi:serine protease Do